MNRIRCHVSYSTKSAGVVVRHGRTRMAKKLGYSAKRWSPDEDLLLHTHYQAGQAGVVSEATGRTLSAVYGRAAFLGIKKHQERVAGANGRT